MRAVLPEGREGALQLVREGHVRVARARTRAARAIRVLRLVRPIPSSPPRILPSPFIPIPVIRPRPRRRVIRPPSPPAVLGDILVIPHGRGRGRRRGGREPVERPAASPGGVVGRGLGFDGGRGRAGALGSGERGAFGRAGVPFFVWVAVPEGAVGPAGVGFAWWGGLVLVLDGWGMGVPRSSRTRLSSSAILFRRRVVSSTEGSSLEREGGQHGAGEGRGGRVHLNAGSSISYTHSPV